jgi:hypothetical protein
MAIAARCYKPFDPAFAARCLAAARLAWTWASQHPNVTFTNPPTVSTGGYGDNDCCRRTPLGLRRTLPHHPRPPIRIRLPRIHQTPPPQPKNHRPLLEQRSLARPLDLRPRHQPGCPIFDDGSLVA